MLKKLRIDNFALIDKASISFETGFTVITGETGSGKSILLNALNLILGERANFGVIGVAKEKSIVEAEIEITGFGLQAFFQANELDYEDTTIVRREIYQQGRSRAFINDVPVQLNTLKDFTSRLIHIHSQYNTLELKDVNYQMEVLDILADSIDLRHKYSLAYSSWLEDKRRLTSLEESYRNQTTQADYNQFQLEELRSIDLLNVDFQGLVEEQKTAENADELKIKLGEVISILTNEEGTIDLLTKLNSSLSKGEQLGKNITELQNRINSVRIELQDIANDAEGYLDNIETDTDRLIELASKVDAYNKLLYKHRLNSQEELINLLNSLESEFVSSDKLEGEIAELQKRIAETEKNLRETSELLHETRLKAIPGIENTIQNALTELKLADTRLIFRLTKQSELNKMGVSKLEMLFSPNKGFEPVHIHQAASGGELSRLMLSLQNLISKKMKLQTIFFDEIDTGVSGDVAQKIGNTLKQMGESMQVIAVTHLPQVAAKGGQHLCVAKNVKGDITQSVVTELQGEARVEEIARLMSGDHINEAAISNAKALMS